LKKQEFWWDVKVFGNRPKSKDRREDSFQTTTTTTTTLTASIVDKKSKPE
jgi:hypothetical protein